MATNEEGTEQRGRAMPFATSTDTFEITYHPMDKWLSLHITDCEQRMTELSAVWHDVKDQDAPELIRLLDQAQSAEDELRAYLRRRQIAQEGAA